MAKEYKVGERYYLPVTVSSIAPGYQYPIELMFVDCDERDTTDTVRIADEPELLLTAEDIAMVINTERDDALEELKSRNAELEALLKEVTATRDEAIRQNDELITKNNELEDANCNLTKACSEWQITAQTCADNAKVADAAADELRKENRELKAKVTGLSVDNDKLKAWYDEANKTASEATEANDELKAKIADLRNRVGEQLAQIQDLNSEVHFLKESGKQKPTEEVTKHAHVVLNDGTELVFKRKDIQVFYRTDIDILVINDGDEVIAGFDRGDNPTNFAYFWTE